MTCHYPNLGSASAVMKKNSLRGKTNQGHYSDLVSDTSSVWNFFARSSSDVISRGNQWWRCQISTVSSTSFPGFSLASTEEEKEPWEGGCSFVPIAGSDYYLRIVLTY